MNDKILNRCAPIGARIIYDLMDSAIIYSMFKTPGKLCRLLIVLVIVSVFLLHPAITTAQQEEDEAGKPVVTLRADHQEVHAGDTVVITLKVEYPPGYELVGRLEFPEVTGLRQESVQIRSDEHDRRGTMKSVGRTFTTLNEGKFIIEPVELIFTGPDGKSVRLKSNGLMVIVLAEDTPVEDLRDIKALKKLKIPIDWVKYFIILLAIAALIILYRFVSNIRKKAGTVEIHPLPMNLEEYYIRKLRELDIPEDFDTDAVMKLYLDMSFILRSYLAERWNISARPETTAEVATELKKAKFGPDVIDGYSDVANTFDMVKYAKGRPCAEDIKTAKDVAMDFILLMGGIRR